MTKEEKKRLSAVSCDRIPVPGKHRTQAAARTSSGCKLAEAARSPAVGQRDNGWSRPKI